MSAIKCVAKVACQTRGDDGIIRYYEAGQSGYFQKCPTHFVPVDRLTSQNVDFTKVSEEFLRDDIIPLQDIVDFCSQSYNMNLAGRSRNEVVNALLHVRGNTIQTLSQTGIAPTAAEFKNENSEYGSGINTTFDATKEEDDKDPEAMSAILKDEEDDSDDVEVAQTEDDDPDGLDSLLNS